MSKKNKFGAYIYNLRENGYPENEIYWEPSLLIWINEDSRNDTFEDLFGEKFNPCYVDCEDFEKLSEIEKTDLWDIILSMKKELQEAVINRRLDCKYLTETKYHYC
jgi:hypothetical protein